MRGAELAYRLLPSTVTIICSLLGGQPTRFMSICRSSEPEGLEGVVDGCVGLGVAIARYNHT
jgi:hypothetical protein